MKYTKNLVGLKFGRLTVMELWGWNEHKKPMYKCLCDCGKETLTPRNKLVCGRTKSCGCYRSDTSRERIKKVVANNFTLHGHHGERLYRIFRGIIRRTRDLNDKDYGGRGIKCEWKNVIDFYSDMAESYDKHIIEHGIKNTTIDRINNDGNYCKENCRWATIKEQAQNKRSVVLLVSFRGETKPLNEWVKEMKVSYGRLYKNLLT